MQAIPIPGSRQDFSTFPIPGTTAQTWYLGPNGTLSNQPPAGKGIDWYTSNASALPPTDFGSNTGSGGLWGNASQWHGTGSRTRRDRRSPMSRLR